MKSQSYMRWLLTTVILSFTLFLVAGGVQPAAAEVAAPNYDKTLTVNSGADYPDDDPGDGKCDTGNNITVSGQSEDECTLRAALDELNGDGIQYTKSYLIEFDIRNSDGSCPNSATIINTDTAYWLAPNPHLYTGTGPTDTYYASYVIRDYNVTIDGFSQCGASPNSSEVGDNADIRIELYGNGTNGRHIGIALYQTQGATIRGLAMHRWGRAIDLRFANENTIAGNYFGLRANGNTSTSRNAMEFYYSDKNVIGGVNLADRNLLADLGHDAVGIRSGSDYNLVYGNYFGLKRDGTGNSSYRIASDAVDIQNGASYNWFGGILLENDALFPEFDQNGDYVLDENGNIANAILDQNGNEIVDERKRNIFGGGNDDALEFTHPGDDANDFISHSRVVGNWIGLDAHGNAYGNVGDGINIEDAIYHTHVYGNVIVNNHYNGIDVWTSHYSEIYNNYIGVRPAGLTLLDGTVLADEAAMPNGVGDPLVVAPNQNGIGIMGGSTHNNIHNNVIANHPNHAIFSWANSTYTYGKGYGSCINEFNTFSQNIMYDNGHANAIQLDNDTCDTGGPALQNEGIGKPKINTSSSTAIVTGSAIGYHYYAGGTSFPNDNSTICANCTIELFIADTDGTTAGQGQTYLGSAMTDESGSFLAFVENVPAGSYLTATATDPNGNTSQFSQNVQVSDPSCTAAVAPTVTASRNGNDVTLNWTHDSANVQYRIYRSTDPYFTPSEATLYDDVIAPGNSFTDEDVIDAGGSLYYVVQAVNQCAAESGASNRYGVAEISLTPGWNLVSLPVVPVGDTSLDSLIGAQLYGTDNSASADMITVWDANSSQYVNSWFCAGECLGWGEPWANHWLSSGYSASTTELEAGMGFWIQNRTGATETFSVFGAISTVAVETPVASGWNMLGSSFPQARSLDQLGLPAYGTNDPLTSNEIQYWNADTQTYESAWFCNCPEWAEWHNKWLDSSFAVVNIVIEPGTGFWYNNRVNGPFAWSNPAN